MRRVIIGLGAAGAIVGLGWAGYLVAFRDTSTPVDRADITAPTVVAAPGGPGVYQYETTGYESVDALSGARHDYPATTYLVITDGACGPVARWEALRERWMTWEHCGPDRAITRSEGYHEWFGVADHEDERCDPALPLVPEEAVTVTCDSGTTTETYRVTPLGAETLTIGGAAVEVDRVLFESEVFGSSTGTSRAEVWVLRGTVLVVRTEVVRTITTPTGVGDVHYEESYTLQVTSVIPTD